MDSVCGYLSSGLKSKVKMERGVGLNLMVLYGPGQRMWGYFVTSESLKDRRYIRGLLFRFKFLQEKMLHIGYMLAETVIFCVFNGQDTEQFPL